MNVLELKGSLHELIAKTDDENRLARMFEAYQVIVEETEVDWWDELTPEQQTALEASLAETENSSKLTSHEEVVKMSRQWIEE